MSEAQEPLIRFDELASCPEAPLAQRTACDQDRPAAIMVRVNGVLVLGFTEPDRRCPEVIPVARALITIAAFNH